jgi:hypothetical protein
MSPSGCSPIRSAVPVNIREPADYKASEALRNLFGFIVVRSPVHCRDPVKRLKAITAEMRSIKVRLVSSGQQQRDRWALLAAG